MKTTREAEFDSNYSVLTFASAVTFTIYFSIFMLFLNLSYIPITFKNNGFIGVLVLFFSYLLSVIALFPILVFINTLLGLCIIKVMKFSYIKNPLLGFFIYPAIMTIIPFFINYIAQHYTLKVNIFDFYYIYFSTWISSLLQYAWLMKYMKKMPEPLTNKQLEFLKRSDKVDYF